MDRGRLLLLDLARGGEGKEEDQQRDAEELRGLRRVLGDEEEGFDFGGDVLRI